MQGTLGYGEGQASEMFLCLLREGPAPPEVHASTSSLASSLVMEQPRSGLGSLANLALPLSHECSPELTQRYPEVTLRTYVQPIRPWNSVDGGGDGDGVRECCSLYRLL